ncbi:MAG: glycoside hydrolase family 127 protein [Gemmatimonadaceae bacterium]
MHSLDRRDFLAQMASGVAAAGLHRATAAPPDTTTTDSDALPATPSTPMPLAAPAFAPLPLGSVRPAGWLQRQLRIQADGLSGHLDQFWPDVSESQWFGGNAEGWERAPYWLDGAIPLAWLLDDTTLKTRIDAHIDYIVSHQRADGWFSPYPLDAAARKYDLWSILLANKVLAQYHEATHDDRALRSAMRSMRAMHAGLSATPLFDWGRFRWYEGVVPALYAFEQTGEPWLLDYARTLRDQGVDFEALMATDDVRVPTPRRGLWKWTKHVVNMAMAPKAAALSWRLDQRPTDRAFASKMVELLDQYHGQVTGMFSGDECLAGKNPLQGSELCAVVEYMYSLEHLTSVFGDGAFADRLERLAYNALPATFAPDMWSHQYVQQVNQVQCTINPDFGWSTNGPESNLYGLEPNYGCCTSNMHQGWPKFTAHLWMRPKAGGLAAMAWAPCRVDTTVDGAPVHIEVDTDYPFREAVTLRVRTERPTRFPLQLRIPAWAHGASVQVANEPPHDAQSGSMHELARTWSGDTAVTVRLPMRPAVTVRYNGAVAVERGPLVYALKIGEAWTRVNADKPHRELPHGDYEVRPTTPWNYGLILDPGDPAKGLQFDEQPVGERPFSPEGAGMRAVVQARRIPDWKIENGWAGEISTADRAWAQPRRGASAEPVEQVTLIPYGCTNIRITEFPRATAES